MKVAEYWAEQEQRWYEQHLETENLLCKTEDALAALEQLALHHIKDEEIRAQIARIVNHVFREHLT